MYQILLFQRIAFNLRKYFRSVFFDHQICDVPLQYNKKSNAASGVAASRRLVFYTPASEHGKMTRVVSMVNSPESPVIATWQTMQKR
jgi:hypothetical protein